MGKTYIHAYTHTHTHTCIHAVEEAYCADKLDYVEEAKLQWEKRIRRELDVMAAGTYVCMYVCMYVFGRVCIYGWMYVCMYYRGKSVYAES